MTELRALPFTASLGEYLVRAESLLADLRGGEETAAGSRWNDAVLTALVAQMLLDAGADPSHYNPDGFHAHSTPLDWAEHGQRTRIADYLRGRPSSPAAATS